MYVCITIEVPFINKTMDFKVPKSMLIGTVIELVCDIICKRYESLNFDVAGAELLSVRSRKLLKKDESVQDWVVNNEKLILI